MLEKVFSPIEKMIMGSRINDYLIFSSGFNKWEKALGYLPLGSTELYVGCSWITGEVMHVLWHIFSQ